MEEKKHKLKCKETSEAADIVEKKTRNTTSGKYRIAKGRGGKMRSGRYKNKRERKGER